MKVTFTKTHERGYRVAVEGPGIISSTMDPAPGYDARLPHDAAHFLVERELGITGGVFGQLASGGSFGILHADGAKRVRKVKKRRVELAKSNKTDLLFSEHAIYAAQSRWEQHDIIPDTKIPEPDIARVIARFEEFAYRWSALAVGGSITLEWDLKNGSARKR